MGFLSQQAVRQRAASALAAVSGWKESRYHPALFGMDTDELMRAKTVFAVEHASLEAARDRQTLSHGAYVASTLRVRVITPLRPDNMVSDGDTTLQREHTAIQTVAAMSQADITAIELSRVSRDAAQEGTHTLSDIEFRIHHRLALQ